MTTDARLLLAQELKLLEAKLRGEIDKWLQRNRSESYELHSQTRPRRESRELGRA